MTEKTVAKMRLFEIKVVPLQPTRSMVRDRFESKRENGWLNLLKSESSKFSQESAKKRMKTDRKRLKSAHNQKTVLTQQSDYQQITRFSTLFLPFHRKCLIIN